MDDVRGDFLGPPHGTTPAAVIANKIKTVSVSIKLMILSHCLDGQKGKKTD